jgi:thiol-disulfide isomerase/thioredoxin
MKSILTWSILMLGSLVSTAQSIFDIEMKEVNTGQSISLKAYQSAKAIAVVFFSVKCPYAKHYEARLSSMAAQYKNKEVSFLLVNANNAESMEAMQRQAEKMSAIYLNDETQQLATALGAKKSPEVFLINANGEVYYRGAIDDNPQVANDVRTHYLRDAIDALIGEKSIAVEYNRPVGCTIK